MKSTFAPALITVVALIALVSGFAYYRLTNQPFDAERVAAEVANHTGASTRANLDLAIDFCGVGVLVGSPFINCLSHNRTPAEVKEVVDKVMRRTDARPLSEWRSTLNGYSRDYRLTNKSSYNTYRVKISRSLIGLIQD
jgi:hypothetical protein